MVRIPVAKILESIPGVKKDGGGYSLSEESDCGAFVSLGQEVLQIPRVARVEIAEDLVTLVTHKGERFFFPPEHLVGLKLGAPSTKSSRSSAAGFSA